MRAQMLRPLPSLLAALALAACSDYGAGALGPGNQPNPGGGNVGFGGAQDFAAFRDALDHGRIPAPSTLDANGFFAEHYTSLPAPTCGQAMCLHGMIAVAPNLTRERPSDWTLAQLGLNTPVTPDQIERPPLDLAVVLDRSGSMAASDKLTYAKQGVATLIDQLGPADTLTLIAFDDQIETLFGPARVTDRETLKARLAEVSARGSTNIYDALEAGYKAVLKGGDERQVRRVIFLTDGLPTAGNTSAQAIESMSAGYNTAYLGLTTIGLGVDVDAGLLRRLSEHGAGNFYFIEKPESVTEVFTQELRFFVAPLAYDIEVGFGLSSTYQLVDVFGSNLWLGNKDGTGGTIRIASAFVTSRTSSEPDPQGGRRGGGSVLMLHLTPIAGATVDGPHAVGQAKLRYRLPGSQTRLEQTIALDYNGRAGVAPAGGYFSAAPIEKNTLMLAFFVAFRDATLVAQTAPAAAHDDLASFRTRIAAALGDRTDADLLDDLKILDQYIDVLARNTR